MTEPPRVEVRVVWGIQKILLWKRSEPAWHMAGPCEDYVTDFELVDDWRAPWEHREGKTMRRAGFRHV